MKKITKIWVEKIPDYDTDLSYLGEFSNTKGEFGIKHDDNRHSYPYFNADNVENMKQAKANYNRIMEYVKGNICDYGVKAFAEIQTSDDGGKSWLINKLSSGGLWGMSSDGNDEEFDSEARQQIADLTFTLEELGFTDRDIKNILVVEGRINWQDHK